MQIGHVGASIQQPTIQALAQASPAAQAVQPKNEEQTESAQERAVEAGRGESVDKLA